MAHVFSYALAVPIPLFVPIVWIYTLKSALYDTRIMVSISTKVITALVSLINVASPRPGLSHDVSSVSIDPIPGIRLERAVASRALTPHRRTDLYHNLRASTGQHARIRSAAARLGAHQRQRRQEDFAYQNVTSTNALATSYAVNVLVDGEPVDMSLDTGSADCWVVHKDFSCVDVNSNKVDIASCAFGPVYPRDFQHGRLDGVHSTLVPISLLIPVSPSWPRTSLS